MSHDQDKAKRASTSADEGGPKPIAARGRNGRFLPGHSGNPAGRPPIRPFAVQLDPALLAQSKNALSRKIIDAALGGDRRALRVCLSALLRPPRPREALTLTFADGTEIEADRRTGAEIARCKRGKGT